MSSSSDIEKLFDHFGGNANAYQEIGRENEARSARTRWPLLVTLDLSQPQIPAIGQRQEARPRPVAQAPVAVDREDSTPKDAASVTRAKAPLFTRSHRRDIPPVVTASAVSATATRSRGASRFGALEAKDAVDERAAAVKAIVPAAAAGNTAGSTATNTAVIPAAITPAVLPVIPPAIPPITQLREPATSQHAGHAAPVSVPVPAQTQMQTPAPAWSPSTQRAHSAPPAFAVPQASTFASPPTWQTQPAQAAQPASILGKLFAAPADAAPSQTAEPATNDAPLQSVFDRLRGTPTPGNPTAAASANAASRHSWLTNGPRRS